MSREIKFRAWDKKRNEWYGESSEDILTFKGFSLFGECTMFDMPPINYLQHIEVMQYTGLKDRNGVDIYEGDIVTTDYPTVKNMADAWVVEYGYTGMYQMALGSFKQSIHELVYNKWKLEVLGNIYQNPELLK